ncbi:MAG TPA: bifunctional DNA-formamidopyrimidine glycosylase/DNA-(apurinic or apyrimidinic site) lyase [Gaiellaceae bacterium]|nr:bifunctional DNA-formamidopyrimidine glycosylase/DNA-(apurinic or apyrimidinic site) lyase [Gaiellaceae bacterium]
MPELPEVETVRTYLEPLLAGRRFERVEISDPRLVRPYEPRAVAAELEGERVAAVERRGKYLIVRFVSGLALLVHLRMTGGFPKLPATHERAVLTLDDGTRVSYRDVRRFGTWEVHDRAAAADYLAGRLGPEPLGPGFTKAFLRERLAGRTAPVKAAILDQRAVAGLGNIYADESLWRARLHPRRPAGDLAADEIDRLHRGIRDALRRGIAVEGTDLGDGVYASGSMQDELHVYGRGGEPCDRCGTAIAKTRVAGRGTWFCPRCQPEVRPRP